MAICSYSPLKNHDNFMVFDVSYKTGSPTDIAQTSTCLFARNARAISPQPAAKGDIFQHRSVDAEKYVLAVIQLLHSCPLQNHLG
jgi:hypothetical protein